MKIVFFANVKRKKMYICWNVFLLSKTVWFLFDDGLKLWSNHNHQDKYIEGVLGDDIPGWLMDGWGWGGVPDVCRDKMLFYWNKLIIWATVIHGLKLSSYILVSWGQFTDNSLSSASLQDGGLICYGTF